MRPRLRKWIKRSVIGLVGLIAGSVALVAIALQTDWGQRQVQNQVEKALAKTFAGEVEIGDMEVGLTGWVTLSNLRIEYPNREVALEIARLSISCKIMPLLAGRVRCGTLRVVEPHFWHRPGAGDLLRPNDDEPGANVKIEAIAIEGGRVELPAEVISGIAASLADLKVDRADVAVHLESLSGVVESQERRIAVEGAVALKNNVVTLSGGAVASGDSVLVVELERFDLDTLELLGSVSGEVAAADVPLEGWRTKIVPDLALGGVAGERIEASGTIGLDKGSIAIEQLSYGERLEGKISVLAVDPSAVHAKAPAGLVTANNVEIDMAPRFELETLEGKAKLELTGTLQKQALGTITVDAEAIGAKLDAKIISDFEGGRGTIEVAAVRRPNQPLLIEKATAKGPLSRVIALVPGLTARRADVNARAKGPLDKLVVKGTATLRGARYDTMSADLARATVDLEAFDVFRAAETAFAGGFDVRVEAPRIGETSGVLITATGGFGKNGKKLGVTATLEGFPKVETATIKADVTLGEAIVATIKSIDATTEGMHWRGNTGEVKVAGAVITTPRKISIAGAAGALTVGAKIKPGRTTIDADIRRLDLRRSKKLHGLDVAAVIDAVGEVTLRGDNLTGEVTAKSAAIAIPGIPKVRGEVIAKLEPDKLAVTVDGAPLAGAGTVHLALAARRPNDIYDLAAWRRLQVGDLISVEGDVKGVDVRQLERFIGTKIKASGRATVALRFPHEGKPVLGIRVDAQRGRYVGVSGLHTRLRATWGTRLEADASLHQAGDKLATANLSVGTPLHTTWQRPESLLGRTLSGTVKVANFSLRRLERLKLFPASIGGFVTTTVSIGGTAVAPALEITEGRAAQVELAGARIRKMGFTGSYRDGQIKARVAGTMRQGGRFEITGGYGLAGRDLAVEISARSLKLMALRPFAPASDHPLADIDGTLDMTKVVVSVNPKAMRASGRVRLRNGTVLLEGGARAITAINASLILRGDKIRLATLTAKNGSGTIRASGEARFVGYTPGDIKIDASAVDIPFVAGSYLASIDVESEITGSYRDGRLALAAPIRRARVDLKDTGVELQSIGDLEDVVFVDNKKDSKGRRRGEPPERGLKTVIAVDLSRGVRVVSAEIDAWVIGAMEVAFVGAEMVSLTGQVRARSGKVKLFERSYALMRAVATFDGPLPINPDLDVEISRTFPEATVTALVTGRLSQVLGASSQSKHIQLSSDADFTEEQILALMLGQSPDDVVQQDTGGQRVGGIGRAIVAGEIRDILRSVGLKVDVVRFHADGWEFGKWVRFSLGDLFSRRVLLGYRFRDAGVQLENTNEGTLELPVTRSVNLEGRVGDRGIGSFDLLWIKRF